MALMSVLTRNFCTVHCVKRQVPRSYGLGFMVFEDFKEKDRTVNYGGVCRTAPATPGLLNILDKYCG